MPKTFYKTFIDSLETHYRTSIPYFAAQYNSAIKLTSFAANDGTNEVRAEIQRMKRLTSISTGINSRDLETGGTETTTSKFAGNALIARLNKLQKVSWESVEVVPAEEKIIGVSVGPKEEKDVLLDTTGYEKTISSKVNAMMEERNELILNELIQNVPIEQKISGIKLDGSADRETFLAVQKAVDFITLQVDEFKKYTGHDKIIALLHPNAVSTLGRHKGEIYQGVPELFDTGVKSDFHIDNIMGFTEPGINAMPQIDVSAAQDGSEMEDLLGIIYDIEGLAIDDPESNKTDFDDKMIGQRYVGTRWYEVLKHFDKKRIVLLCGTKLASNLSTTSSTKITN